MNFWKALLLVSFLVYAVHCEEQEEVKDAVADVPQENEDEASFDEDDEQLEDKDENDESDPSYRKFISKKRVIVYANKNVGQCSTSTKRLSCWKQQKCVRYTKNGYGKRCVKTRVQRICNLVTTTTCKLCTKSLFKTCYQLHYGVRCYKSHVKVSCARKVSGRSYQFNKVVKTYYIKKW